MNWTEQDELIQSWMRDFDKLSIDQKHFNNTPPYVDINGEKMDVEKYLNYKLNTIQP